MTPRAALHLSFAVVLLASCAPAVAVADDGEWNEGYEQASPGSYDVQVDVDSARAVTLDQFQAGLSPYGAWVSTGFGTAWRPSVAPGWRPYYYGRWEWTNEGWLWVSDEPFGWATYHYGRWAWDGGHGWVWVPGYQWAPAWVSWRYGADVVGWAPLAPGLSLYVTNYAFVDFWWTFVPSFRFCGTPIWGVAHSPSHAWRYYGLTNPAPPRPRPAPSGFGPRDGGPARPPAGARPAPGWGGPPQRYIEERTGRPIPTSRIVAAPRPGAAPSRSGEIGVYRPELAPRVGGAARPVPADRSARPSSPMMPAQPRPGQGWERGAPPATRGPAAPPSGPRYEGRPGTPPSAPRHEGRPSAPPAAPRYEGRPSAPPVAPRYEGRPSAPPAAPRYEGRPSAPPSAPRYEGRPSAPPSAPRSEGRTSAPPAAPRFEGRPAPAPGGSSAPSGGGHPAFSSHRR